MGCARPLDSLDTVDEAASYAATVLVVEDEVLLRMVVAEELREQGCTVVEAANSDEALSILQSGTTVHIVFTDVNMPGMLDGIDLARIVCAKFPGIDVVVTSGHLGNKELDWKIEGFFSKPYDLQKLVAHIRLLFERRNARSTSVVVKT
jgi:two-component system, response regulator PdtaR